MIRFTYLDKSQKDKILPALFDILYENMHSVAPSKMSYHQEKERYITAVSRALNRESRKILLCTDNDSIAGFVQYYTTADTLMIEEVQMTERLQGTLAFYKMCRQLANDLPASIKYIEAFADKRNLRSQKLMLKSGMQQTDSECPSSFIHFRGDATTIKSRFYR